MGHARPGGAVGRRAARPPALRRGGCDVISTNTWGLRARCSRRRPVLSASEPVHWLDLARRGLRLARQAVGDSGCAVAFSLNGDVDTDEGETTIRLLARLFADEAPDLILLETLVAGPPVAVRGGAAAAGHRPARVAVVPPLPARAVQRLRAALGRPGGRRVRARGGALRADGGRRACWSTACRPTTSTGWCSYLRDFTDLPLGVYPNLGYYTNARLALRRPASAAEYARMALRWRAEGAQIVGGCCGVRPDHIAAARGGAGRRTRAGRRRRAAGAAARRGAAGRPRVDRPPGPRASTRSRSRDLVADPGVAPPGAGSLHDLAAPLRRGDRRRTSAASTSAAGTGILGGPARAQRRLPRARHRHRRARGAQHRANAFRNGVGDRVSAARSTSTRGCRRSATR